MAPGPPERPQGRASPPRCSPTCTCRRPAQEKREQAADEDEDDDDADAEAGGGGGRGGPGGLEENHVDFPMEFARDLLAQTKSASRRGDAAGRRRRFFDKVRADEDKKLAQALEKLGVDWSPGPANPAAGQVQVTLSTPGADGKVVGRQDGEDPGHGEERRHRRRCTGCARVLKSENPYFDENEMVFGKLAPGESKTFDLDGQGRQGHVDPHRRHPGRRVRPGAAARPTRAELTLNIEGKPRPLFAYNYQTVDDVKGNQRRPGAAGREGAPAGQGEEHRRRARR